MELEFRSHYWNDASARQEFIRFTRQMHGLDLTAWYEAGFWDDDYAPFSFFEGPRIVATACVYLLEMMIDGRRCHVPQVSAVGTEPAWRRRGLNRDLTERGLDWARQRNAADMVFLFADEDAIPFYERCGYRHVAQQRVLSDARRRVGTARARRLDFDDPGDVWRVAECAAQRVAVSNVLGCLNPKLLMFHALHTLRSCAYLLPDLDAVVFAAPVGRTLRLYDVVASQVPSIAEVLDHLPSFDTDAVELMFMPDKVDAEAVFEPQDDDQDGTHVRGAFPLDSRSMRFPFTAHA